MKPILVLLIVCAMAWAAPPITSSTPIAAEQLQTVYSKAEDVMLDDEGHFSVRFVSEDGTTVKEEGILVEDDSTGDLTAIVQRGYYAYISNDGMPIELVYDASKPGDIVMDQ